MSLIVFENFLCFSELVVGAKEDFPSILDAAELESALVGHGVVLLYSHMEQCMRASVDARLSRCLDAEASAFAIEKRKETTGKIGIEYLKKTLGRFSSEYQESFKKHLDRSGYGDSWNSVVNQRQRVAHEGLPALMTLPDLRLYYEHVRKVLGFLCDSLRLTSTEIDKVSPLIVQTASDSLPFDAIRKTASDAVP